ncbi:MAG: hypothetical protein H6721_22610 [Sandaracinus sp.]|nr:hypothetical protein [Sandaracinus sp.]MCB9634926.1 hypothetical protein [Sandaracinus sp.]
MKPEHVAIGLLGLLVVVQSVRGVLARSRGRRLAARARRLGAEGEARAESLLREGGYRVLDRQVAASYALHVDGERVEARVRADFLVSRGGKRFVADAKRGPEASRADRPATRRQLLEYRHAYAVDGVLLIDAERGAVREIELPSPERRATFAERVSWWAWGALAGAAVVWALRA